MKYVNYSFVGIVIVISTFLFSCDRQKQKGDCVQINKVTSPADLVKLFPQRADELTCRVAPVVRDAQKTLQEIIALPSAQRTFANTMGALDTVSSLSELATLRRVAVVIENTHPDEAMRKAAIEVGQTLDGFIIDNIVNNAQLYNACADYVEHNQKTEHLSDEQKYYCTERMKEFIRSGAHLPEDKRVLVRQLQKDLAQADQEFGTAIATDLKSIAVDEKGLQGLSASFIASLPRNADGSYRVGVDYPTYIAVMESCDIEDTRKRLYLAFSTRAYPSNDVLLKKVIQQRQQLATLLGFKSYADLELDGAMALSPDNVERFLYDMLMHAQSKAQQEFALLAQQLPDNVSLNPDGTLNPWSSAYVKAQYKKKHLALDETSLAEYFEMGRTIQGLFDIYQNFFDIKLTSTPTTGLWHSDVTLITLSTNDNTVLGYLLIDLYPRDNKYTHACEITVIPSVTHNGNRPIAVAVVLANFPKPTTDKPSLMRRDDVKTFFHEFGHALHDILGRTRLGSHAGTSVKRDFVEMPSQMLEEWLTDSDVLKNLGKHYKTSQPLADDIITKIQSIKTFDSGDTVCRQVALARLSLACFMPGETKDPDQIYKVWQKLTRPYIALDSGEHMPASFGHLMGYGSQYYSYLWSLVYALDLFNTIKSHGLTNKTIGKKYVTNIIGQGGSKDPNQLLHDFLGRAPMLQPFYAAMGFEDKTEQAVSSEAVSHAVMV